MELFPYKLKMIILALHPFLAVSLFTTHGCYDELDVFEYVTTFVFVENASELIDICIVFIMIYIN